MQVAEYCTDLSLSLSVSVSVSLSVSMWLSPSQIMVLTDPEFESSVLVSSDEGASFQKYRLSFYILSLLFHPTQEDWALAYSHDQKVTSSSVNSPTAFHRLGLCVAGFSSSIKGYSV
jgi:hypothetical protein